MSIFACLIVLAFWFGFWLWFLSDDPSPDGRKAVSSPPALDSRGHFIHCGECGSLYDCVHSPANSSDAM